MGTPFTRGTAIDPYAPPEEAPYASLTPTTFPQSLACTRCRNEAPFTIQKDNKLLKFVVRDKILPEDPYMVMIKAGAYALAHNGLYPGTTPNRATRGDMIRNNLRP